MKPIFLHLKVILVSLSIAAKMKDNSDSNGLAKEAMPFMVSVQLRKEFGYEHFCGGTIIHENFILTAAHCFYDRKRVEKLSVIGGSNQLTIYQHYLRRNVSRYIIHPSFFPLYGYDIALLETHPKFDFSDNQFAKLNYLDDNESSVTNGTETWLLGWGRSNEHLEMVHFEIISRELCRSKGFNHVTKTEICAVSFKGRGACDGDSGGPLVSSDLKNLLALLSFGKSFCMPRRIYAFTWVKPLIPWINQNIKSLKNKS